MTGIRHQIRFKHCILQMRLLALRLDKKYFEYHFTNKELHKRVD